MHITPLPRKTLLILFILNLFLAGTFAQEKSLGEVTLSRCWSFALGGGRQLGTDNKNIFIASDGGRVAALSADGKKLWQTELGGSVGSNILATDTGIFVVTLALTAEGTVSGDGTIRFLSKETGVPGWTAKLPASDGYRLGSFNNALIVVARNGSVESLEPASGTVRWKREVASAFVGEPHFGNPHVAVISAAGQVFVIAEATGEIETMRKLDPPPLAVGEVGGTIVTGGSRGRVISLAPNDKYNWRFKSGGAISHVFAIHDSVLAASNDNFLYLLTARSGGLEWKRRLTGRVAQIGVIGSKYALVSSLDQHGALLIELVHGRVAGQIALDADETLVAAPMGIGDELTVLTDSAAYGYSTTGCKAKE
jgi:outer membrane protein assembly factor BamB